jgi:hypothetical protein
MYEAAFKVARANPGTSLDVQHSNTYELLLRNDKKKKFWSISNKGKIRRLTQLPG